MPDSKVFIFSDVNQGNSSIDPALPMNLERKMSGIDDKLDKMFNLLNKF